MTDGSRQIEEMPARALANTRAGEDKALDGQSRAGFPVVGIGASAGGLSALKRFFQDVPETSGVAFVVVMHLSSEHKSRLAELLQPQTSLPVLQVTSTVALEPNKIYVIPPNANLESVDTHLRITELEPRRIERAPIDRFFRTLAQTHDGDSMGVVLTGTGSDGTLGLREIKEKGGLTMVQEPSDAEYRGMPQSALSFGLADVVLPLSKIPEAILRYGRWQPRLPMPEEGQRIDSETDRLLQKLFELLEARKGQDFSHYNRRMLMRRIKRRMQLRQVEEFADYLELLRSEADEARALTDDLLLTDASFFRSSGLFSLLAEKVIPELFDAKESKDELRVWSVGCSTGEEVYSLAILLLEESARRKTSPRLRVFASDIHVHSLKWAREGFYPGDIEADVSEERLKRFFTKESGGYRIRKEVRDAVVFAPHDLLRDPPFLRLDLIACSNLLNYVQSSAQHDVMQLLHYALKPHGFLAFGNCESLPATDLYAVRDRSNCLLQKREALCRAPTQPLFPRVSRFPTRKSDEGRTAASSTIKLHQRMLERYAPASALINPDDTVAHLSERAGRYLLHPGGEPTSNIFKLIREELRADLRANVFSAREQGQPVRSRRIPLRLGRETVSVSILAQPSEEPQEEGFVLVLFDERRANGSEGAPEGQPSGEDGAVSVQELQAELDLARQRLLRLAQQYETSQEEMSASNAEMQSLIEELRATLDELGVSKEQLERTNDQLQRANRENRDRVEELDQLSCDLQNLLAATDIATLFLNRELCIMRFTPRVQELFSMRLIDQGRPLSDLRHHLGYDELEADARRALEQGLPIEREVQDRSGHHYLVRILPYRNGSEATEGVVLTFLDISARKETENKIRREKLNAEQVIASLPEPLLVLSPDLSVRTANTAFYQRFHVGPEETEGRKIYELGNRQWDIPQLRRRLEKALNDNETFRDFEVTRSFEKLGLRDMILNARRLDDRELILVGIHDITERKRAEEALRENDKRFRMLVEQVQDYAIFLLDTEGRGTFWNEGVKRVLGFDESEFLGQPIIDRIYTEEDHKAGVPQEELREAEKSRSGTNDRWMRRKDGSRFWASGITTAQRDGAGRLIGYMKVMRDLTEQKGLEDELKRSTEELAESGRRKDEFLAMLAHELRNPLAPIRTGLELIKMSDDKLASLEELHEMLERQTSQLVTLVDDLLDVSRVTRGKLTLRTRRVEAGELVRNAVEGSMTFLGQDQKLVLSLPDEPIYLNADPNRLAQIISNLLHNAAKYTPEVGRIGVSLARREKEVALTVTDTGIGIRSDKLEEIFGMFSQIDHSIERGSGGLGLGLTLVKSLVELHGGRIEAASGGIGQGSSFSVHLPVAETEESQADEGSPRADEHSPTEGRRVLVVDDNKPAVKLMSLVVKKLGHEVRAAYDGQQAIEIAGAFRPEVIIMDVGMPRVDGHEAARRMRREPWGKDMILIALTGWATDADKLKSKEAGFDYHLSKPAELADLRKVLDRVR